MKIELAVIRNKGGDGMGTLKIEVIRKGDGESLCTIRYNPDNISSCNEMELELASICGRYGVEIADE